MRRFVVWMTAGLFIATVLIAGGVLNTSAGNVIFHTNVQVSDDAGGAEQTAPDICMHTTDIYTVWQDSRNSDRDIYFSRSTSHGATFGANVRVDDSGTADTFTPAMAVDSNGKIYVVFSDTRSGTNRIYVCNSTDKGATFGSSVQVDDAGAGAFTLKFPDIAVTPSDKLIIAWSDGRNGESTPDIYYSTSTDGETWSANVRISDDTAGANLQSAPAIAVYQNNVYVAWEDERSGNLDVRCRKSSDGGTSFSTPSVVVSDGTGSQKTPSISTDGSGNVYVAWTDFRGSNYNINCANSTDAGATFSALNKVDNGGVGTSQYDPSIYAFNETHLMCSWTDNQGDSSENIFFALSNDKGVTWHNHTQVDDAGSAPTSDQSLSVVASNATGDAQVVWVDNRNSDRDIYFGQMDYSIPPVNLAPTLDYLNITPTVGSPQTNFLFQLTYTDLDGDLPDTGYPLVYVYSDTAGTVPYKSSPYVMGQASSGDTDVTDGKDYVKTLSFDSQMNFSYKYSIKSLANIDIVTSPLLSGPDIDDKEVLFTGSSVGGGEWYTRSDIWCNVTISDFNGSGVDGENILYRHTKTGMQNVSRWYQIPDKPHNESIFMFKAMVFAEGDQNYIQWNASDVAGNGPTFSEPYNIKVDLSEISFISESPVSGKKVNTTELDFQVTVTDTDSVKITDGVAVSGVNVSSLETRFKPAGGAWSEWNASQVSVTTSNDTHHRLLVHLKNLTKGSNLVQLRGNDIAGTGSTGGYTLSEEYSIVLDEGLNFAPSAPQWIYPNSTSDTTPKISWGGASDPEGDALTYYIQIGTATQKDYILPWASTGPKTYYDVAFELKKDMTYLIQLKCSDGSQYSPVFETNLDITSTGNQPPSAPTNIQPKVTTVYNPTITWDPSSDTDSVNIMYFIQISTSEGMGDILAWTQVFGTATSYDVAGTLGLEDGTYVIEIQAFDGLDYSDIAVSTLKIAVFEIDVTDFTTDLYVGEVGTYMVKFTNLGTSSDVATIYLDGTIFDQASVFIDDVEFDLENNTGIVYSFAINESKDMKMQFRVHDDAAAGTYSLSFEVFSESGEKTGGLIKNDIGITKRSGGGGGGGNGTDDDDDDYGPDKFIRDWWWALLIGVAVFLILVVAIGVASSKSKKKKEDESRKRRDYDDMYRDRGSAEVEYSPRDGGRPPPRYDSPASRQYDSGAAMYDQPPAQQQQQTTYQEPAYQEPVQDQYMDAMMAEAPAPVMDEQVVEYKDEAYDEPMQDMEPIDDIPEDDDAPKDIYGYDEDDDLDDLEMEPLDEDDDDGDDGDYLSIDDM